MKAIVVQKYGSADFLKLTDVEKPAPKANELLINVHATSLNAADARILHADPFFLRLSEGLFKPSRPILGSDVAGTVEAVGAAVTQFKPGDAVYGDLSDAGRGAFAEYVCAPASVMAHKPHGLSWEEVAAVPMASVTALQALRDFGRIEPQQHVLIHGASGGVGTFALQLAKAFGAEVTAVCSSANVEQARTLGADHVIDYKQTDFTQSGQAYDLIAAVNGARPMRDYVNALTPTGTYVVVGGSLKQIFQAALTGWMHSSKGGKTIRTALAKANKADLETVSDLLTAGKIAPTIDRSFRFEQLPEAMRYFEQGHARGKLVIAF